MSQVLRNSALLSGVSVGLLVSQVLRNSALLSGVLVCGGCHLLGRSVWDRTVVIVGHRSASVGSCDSRGFASCVYFGRVEVIWSGRRFRDETLVVGEHLGFGWASRGLLSSLVVLSGGDILMCCGDWWASGYVMCGALSLGSVVTWDI